MKHIKKYALTVAVFVTLLISCRDDDWAPYPDWNDNVGAATKITVNAARNSYRLSSGIANEFFEFNLDVDGYEITQVSEVELSFTFFEAAPVRTVGPLVLKTISTFPATVQITSQEAATAIGFTVNDFQTGDRMRLTFPILTADGRRLTVALNSELCVQPAQPLFGNCQVNWNVVN